MWKTGRKTKSFDLKMCQSEINFKSAPKRKFYLENTTENGSEIKKKISWKSIRCEKPEEKQSELLENIWKRKQFVIYAWKEILPDKILLKMVAKYK